MKKGKIPYNSLIRSVLRVPFLQKETQKIAQDGALLCEEADVYGAVNTTVYGGPYAEELAFYRSFNSALAAGIEPERLLLSLTLPVKERETGTLAHMNAFQAAAKREKTAISGGHTMYAENTLVPVLTCVISGKNVCLRADGRRNTPEPGADLILTGFTGDAGAAVLYQEEKEMLEKRFSPGFLMPVTEAFQHLSCRKETEIFREAGAVLHDVSEGGILGALWEFSEGYQIGFTVDELSIPIHQETVEICDVLQGNPYTLLSTGCMLAAVKNGQEVLEKLTEAGIPAAIIGHTDSGVKKLLIRRDEVHYLDRPQPDLIFSLKNFG